MRIVVTSVLGDEQAKALRFYIDVLGFVKKTDILVGEARWLTIVSPDNPGGTDLLLEPDQHPAAKPFKRARVDDSIPFTPFASMMCSTNPSGSAPWACDSCRLSRRWVR